MLAGNGLDIGFYNLVPTNIRHTLYNAVVGV